MDLRVQQLPLPRRSLSITHMSSEAEALPGWVERSLETVHTLHGVGLRDE